MKYSKLFLLMVTVFTLVFSSCTKDEEKATGTIEVFVTIQSEDASSGVSVFLYDENENRIDDTDTDTEGKAIFTNVATGTYKISGMEVVAGYPHNTVYSGDSGLFQLTEGETKTININLELL